MNIEYSNSDRAPARWRLLRDGDATAARNMAIDEALLRAASENPDFAPTLRFYGWQPSAVSIGRFQRAESLQLDESVSWIRRPTGGRAVWHQHEITFSIVLREEHLPRDASSVVASYRHLSQGFLHGLAALGVRANIAKADIAKANIAKANIATKNARRTSTGEISSAPISNNRTANNRTSSTRCSENAIPENATPENDSLENHSLENASRDDLAKSRSSDGANCFESATRADFVVDGCKLLGAAQCRHGGALLQHGSLLLDIDRALWRARVGGDLRRVIALKELGIETSAPEIRRSLEEGVSQAFNVSLYHAVLSAREDQLANLLLQKYQSSLWNQAGRDEFGATYLATKSEERALSVL